MNACVEVGGSSLLRDVSFTANAGELIALVGPNGAGKSTLLSLLAGDREPTTGDVLTGDRPPRRWRARDLGRFRAVMVQQQQMSFGFSVAETVALGRMPHPATDEDDAVIEEAIAAADLGAMTGRDVTTLSGGETARVGFARAIAQTAPVLLLDEPTAALDLQHQEALLGTARSLRTVGCCVVVVLHDLNLAARYADRILVLAEGRLVADGTPAEVLTAETVGSVYDQEVAVLEQPETGLPLVVPLSRPAMPLGAAVTRLLTAD